jgi:dihydroneopterin aldolase
LTFDSCIGPVAALTAPELARVRANLPAGRTLLLGGGDNAVENALYLVQAGHSVTLWSRSPLRAQQNLIALLEGCLPEKLTLRIATAMPQRLSNRLVNEGLTQAAPTTTATTTWLVESTAYGQELFDHVAVLFGNEPDNQVLDLLAQGAQGCSVQDLFTRAVFLAGDLSGRWHPSISTAIGDGIQAAKQVQNWLDPGATPSVLDPARVYLPDQSLTQKLAPHSKPLPKDAGAFLHSKIKSDALWSDQNVAQANISEAIDATRVSASDAGQNRVGIYVGVGSESSVNTDTNRNTGSDLDTASKQPAFNWQHQEGGQYQEHKQGVRLLSFKKLRLRASLGILEHELIEPQPIEVDAELNLGIHSLHVRDDAIKHVLDYRKIRQIILDECTTRHTNLLESLVGKICMRLMQLPSVLGVRVRVTKLEIFQDCEVAISMEVGKW